jgi:hypothetical protein
MSSRRDNRKSKRISALKPTYIFLKGQRMRVSDISNDGIGIVLPDDAPPFSIGERLAEIPIPLESGTVAVQGIVSHISFTAAGKTCGIQFLFSGSEYDAVMRFKNECMQTLATQEKP